MVKYGVVRRVLREQPDRWATWIDDEVTPDSQFTPWARHQPGLLTIGPVGGEALTTGVPHLPPGESRHPDRAGQRRGRAAGPAPRVLLC